MATKTMHVIPTKGRWGVKKSGAKATGEFTTKRKRRRGEAACEDGESWPSRSSCAQRQDPIRWNTRIAKSPRTGDER